MISHTKERKAIRDDEGESHQEEGDDNGQERPVVPATPLHSHGDNSRVVTPIVSSSHVYEAHSTVLLYTPSVPMSKPVAHTSQAHTSNCPSSAVSSPCDIMKEDDKKKPVLQRSAILGSISTGLVIAHSIFTHPEEMSKHIYTQR